MTQIASHDRADSSLQDLPHTDFPAGQDRTEIEVLNLQVEALRDCAQAEKRRSGFFRGALQAMRRGHAYASAGIELQNCADTLRGLDSENQYLAGTRDIDLIRRCLASISSLREEAVDEMSSFYESAEVESDRSFSALRSALVFADTVQTLRRVRREG